jgi:hypothetical protein
MKATVLFVCLLISGGLLAGAVVDADAATAQNINTSGTACTNYNASQALDIDYFTYGVRNVNAAARPVVCPIARHPVTGPGQNFYVDGSNSGGASTSCSISAFNYTGAFQSSASFTDGAATYDHFTSLPTVSYYSYISLFCTLPGSGQGVLFGVTALDN